MSSSNRDQLHFVARMFGINPDNPEEGKERREDASRDHDWTRFLLAKDMYAPGLYEGPDWVPYSLWSATTYAPSDEFAKPLVFSAGARELWDLVERTYKEPNQVAMTVPMRLAEIKERWNLTSKRGPAEHRDQMLRLKANCLAVANEVDTIEAMEDFETGTKFDFMRLYSAPEQEQIRNSVFLHNLIFRKSGYEEAGGAALGYRPGDILSLPTNEESAEYLRPRPEAHVPIPYSTAQMDAWLTWGLLGGGESGLVDWGSGIVPPVAKLLRQLADFFESRASEPALQRPSFPNAERNFYARGLCEYFHSSYRQVSPAIVARIISIFFEQGITENDISQMVKKLPGPEYLAD